MTYYDIVGVVVNIEFQALLDALRDPQEVVETVEVTVETFDKAECSAQNYELCDLSTDALIRTWTFPTGRLSCRPLRMLNMIGI